MKHLTAVLAGTAAVMAAAGLALSVYNYLSDRSGWELYDDEDVTLDDEPEEFEGAEEPAEEAEEEAEEPAEEPFPEEPEAPAEETEE